MASVTLAVGRMERGTAIPYGALLAAGALFAVFAGAPILAAALRTPPG